MVICMQLMREPWKNVLNINPMMERIETNPQFAQVIAPNEMVALVTLNVKIGDAEGIMNICLPYITVETIMDKLNTKYWYSTMQDNCDEDYKMYLESLVKRVQIPVTSVLGKSSISVSDFVNLQIGDIIRLDSRIDEELSVYVGKIKKFAALPGSSKDKYAVRVTTVIREGE